MGTTQRVCILCVSSVVHLGVRDDLLKCHRADAPKVVAPYDSCKFFTALASSPSQVKADTEFCLACGARVPGVGAINAAV